MRRLILLFFFMVLAHNSFSGEIAHFNTDLLGKNINNSIDLLKTEDDKKSNVIYPKIIQLDIDQDMCRSASLFFSDKDITIEKVRKIINEKYRKPEHITGESFWCWRIDEGKYTISLYSQEECSEDYNQIVISYIAWHGVEIKKVKKLYNHLKENQ
ncbi:MAG: hypothetical protein AB1349_14455 [Elusimicrobiota bacterium]